MKTNFLCAAFFVASILATASVTAANKSEKAKFYDFSDQMIDGEIKRPVALVMETRVRAKFEKLLKLKKSFRTEMLASSHDPLLK
jgi:hypothetical protein